MCGLQSRDSEGRNMLMNKSGAKHLVAAYEQDYACIILGKISLAMSILDFSIVDISVSLISHVSLFCNFRSFQP